MKVWDIKTGHCIKTIEGHQHFVTCVDFNKTSPLIATGSVGMYKIYLCFIRKKKKKKKKKKKH